MLHLPPDPPVGVIPLHHMKVVANAEAHGGSVHRGVIVQGSVKGNICLHSEHNWLSFGLLQLEQGLALGVTSEVFSFLVQTKI